MSSGFSPRSVSVLGSYLDHAAMVSAGIGVCFVPKSLADVQVHDVVYCTLVNPTVGLTGSISWYERRMDSVGRSFVHHCISEFSTPESDAATKGKS